MAHGLAWQHGRHQALHFSPPTGLNRTGIIANAPYMHTYEHRGNAIVVLKAASSLIASQARLWHGRASMVAWQAPSSPLQSSYWT